MKDFQTILYESVLVAFGKILSKYNTFAQGSILRDVGKEIMEYLGKHGYKYDEKGTLEDISLFTNFFIKNGFADKLEVEPADRGSNYIWKNLYGIEAYKELHDVSDNPFLACPLNLCLYYITDKHNKSLKLLSKSFDIENKSAQSQYELVDKVNVKGGQFDALVIENARLYELAQERAEKLEKALNEIKTLKGILPICASCKKIRNDKGYWQQVEVYVHDHSDAEFSHGYCPECYDKAMKELEENIPVNVPNSSEM
jgi:hypothetical protein